MKLLQVKLVFVLFFFPFFMFGEIDNPDIKYVSVDPVTNEIVIAWNASTSFNLAYTGLSYVTSPGFGNPMINLMTTTEDSVRFSLDTIDKINADIPTHSVDRAISFAVTAYDSNSEGSSSLNSFHTTMFLSGSYLSCPDRMFLSWTPYTCGGSTNIQVQSYAIYGYKNGIKTLLTTLSNSSRDHTFSPSEANSFSCFFIKATFISSDGKTYNSTSNMVCLSKNEVDKPDFLEIERISVNDTNGIELTALIDSKSGIKKYVIAYNDSPNGAFSVIDSTSLNPIEKDTTILYVQNKGTLRENYYKIYAIDACNSLLDSSQAAGNIALTIDDSDPFINELSWNEYIGWQSGVLYYDILRSTDNGTYESIQLALPGNTTFTDDLEVLSKTKSYFCYKIKAQKRGSNNSEIWSTSNTICIDKSPRVFIPNSIYPKSSVEKNRYFKVFSSFLSSDGFSLSVYDRWGKELFQTNSPDESWDATVNGTPVQQGSYIYNLQYKKASGEIVEEKGLLHVIY